jgi:hypothetical protein
LLARKHGSDFIAVHASQLEIEHYGIDGVFATHLNSCCTIGRGQDPVAVFFQEGLLSFQNPEVIVNAEDRGHNH